MTDLLPLPLGHSEATTLYMFDDKPDTVERLEYIWKKQGFKTEYLDNRIDLEELIERLLHPASTKDEVVVPAIDVMFSHSFNVYAGSYAHQINDPHLAGVEIIEFLTREVGLADVPYILMSSTEDEQEVLRRVASLSQDGFHVSFISKHDSEEKVIKKTCELLQDRAAPETGDGALRVPDDLLEMLSAGQITYKSLATNRHHMYYDYSELNQDELRELIRSRIFEALSSRAEDMRLGATPHVPLFDGNKIDYMFIIELLQNLPIRVDDVHRFVASVKTCLFEFLQNGGRVEYPWGGLVIRGEQLIFKLASPQQEDNSIWKKPDKIELI